MSRIAKMLFLCAILHGNTPSMAQTLYIPAEIEGGGTVRIDAENDHDLNRKEISLADGEKGRIQFRFEEEGTWLYTLYQPDSASEGKDRTVYVLKIICLENGKVENVMLYEKDSGEKAASAFWHNSRVNPSPNTADHSLIRIYSATSCISLLIAAVMFRLSKGEDDEI